MLFGYHVSKQFTSIRRLAKDGFCSYRQAVTSNLYEITGTRFRHRPRRTCVRLPDFSGTAVHCRRQLGKLAPALSSILYKKCKISSPTKTGDFTPPKTFFLTFSSKKLSVLGQRGAILAQELKPWEQMTK
ncbi:MAG: hypothetical protein AAGN35_23070 [Bacteroidota bacterium]